MAAVTTAAAVPLEGVTVVPPPRRRTPVGRVALYAVLLVAGLVAALPFFWMVFGSFKTGPEIRQIPPTFVPETWTLDNYRQILTDPDLPLLTFYRNSMFVAVTNVVATLFTVVAARVHLRQVPVPRARAPVLVPHGAR